MKVLLIFPPQWMPISPHYSVASLVAQLKAAGYDSKVRDLNVDFFNYVLRRDYLENIAKNLDTLEQQALKVIQKEYCATKKEQDYSADFQHSLYKFTKIKEFKNTKLQLLKTIPTEIEDAIKVLRADDYYKPEKLIKSLNVVDSALEIASLPYLPSELGFHDYYNRFMKLTYSSIKEFCLDRKTNMFYDFYEKVLDDIIAQNNDMIALSINSTSQVVAGLTLAMLLKKKTNAHITIGGNFFSRVIEGFENNQEFFDIFADSLMYEEGEIPIVKLAAYVNNEISIDEVPNLVYSDKNAVKTNPKTVPLLLNDTIVQDLSDFELNKYFTPQIVLPIMSSRGCYWRKCTFCDQDFGQHHNVKDVDILVNQLSELKEKFGIEHFEFVDESISVPYFVEFSQKLIEKNLKINWFINARLEREFTKETLELGVKAGLKMILWGLESGSKKVMKDINKGIDIDNRLNIMRDASNAGIWNFAFIFFGFPTETYEDALMTIDMITKNTDIIASYGRSVFTLGKHTRLKDTPEKFGITNIYHNNEEFSPTYFYDTDLGMSQKQINEISNLCTQECQKAYGNPMWMHLRYREALFLYISKYGAKYVQNLKVT